MSVVFCGSVTSACVVRSVPEEREGMKGSSWGGGGGG